MGEGDLVTRLRALADEAPSTWVGGLCREAADALELIVPQINDSDKCAAGWRNRAEKAEADAAALREAATKVRAHSEGCIVFDNPIGCSCGLDSRGAALLERHERDLQAAMRNAYNYQQLAEGMVEREKKLEAVAEAAKWQVLDHPDDTECGLVEALAALDKKEDPRS